MDKEKEDAWRFAASMVRDYGAHALTSAKMRVRLLESEGRNTAADLWRDVAKQIERMQSVGTARQPH